MLLTGGNASSDVVRVGATVRKAWADSTPAVGKNERDEWERIESVVRSALGAATGSLAVSSHTDETLPPTEQQARPDAEAISHALDRLDGD